MQFTWHYPKEIFPGEQLEDRPNTETREWTYVGPLDEVRLAAFIKSRPVPNKTPPFIATQPVLAAARILKPPANTTPLADVISATRAGGAIESVPWKTEGKSVVGSFTIDMANARVDVKVRIVCVEGFGE